MKFSSRRCKEASGVGACPRWGARNEGGIGNEQEKIHIVSLCADCDLDTSGADGSLGRARGEQDRDTVRRGEGARAQGLHVQGLQGPPGRARYRNEREGWRGLRQAAREGKDTCPLQQRAAEQAHGQQRPRPVDTIAHAGFLSRGTGYQAVHLRRLPRGRQGAPDRLARIRAHHLHVHRRQAERGIRSGRQCSQRRRDWPLAERGRAGH